ncbi:MAG: POTRA domain-containing protein, partial [Gammaproteobacteria bacterium]
MGIGVALSNPATRACGGEGRRQAVARRSAAGLVVMVATVIGSCGMLVPRSAFAELVIEGIDGELLDNARAYANLQEVSCDAPDWRIRRGFRTLDADLTTALRALGYYEPTFSKNLEFEAECWRARVVVEPGPRTRYRKVDIRITGSAEDDAEFLAAVQKNRPREGEPLHQGRYNAYKDRLRVAAAERGYVEAKFTTARVDVWPEERAAEVTLHFASGPRYRIGEVTIEQDFLEPGLVGSYLELAEGQPYDA